MKSKSLTIMAIFFLVFTFNAYADENLKVDSFSITKNRIVVNRTLAYGLFKEDATHKFEYEGSKREWGRIWEDYFVHTELLESKRGAIDPGGGINDLTEELSGDYKLYSEFFNLSAPAVMNWVTPASMAVDLIKDVKSIGKFMEAIEKLKELTSQISNISNGLDYILLPLELISGWLDENDPLRKAINDISKINGDFQEILKRIPTDPVEVDKDGASTISSLVAVFMGLKDVDRDELKKEFTTPGTYKKIITRCIVKGVLEPVSIERTIDRKKYDTLDIYLYDDLHLGETVIKKGNYMPVEYVVKLFTAEDNKEDLKKYKYYFPIARYFTKSHKTNIILKKLKNKIDEMKSVGKILQNFHPRDMYDEIKVANLKGVASYIADEAIKKLLEELGDLGADLATEIALYIAPGTGQIKAVTKAGKAANTIGKFVYDAFTAPKVIPFKVDGDNISLSYFTDLSKFSFLLYPDGVNREDRYNNIADAIYESYFLYGTGLEENGFKPYDINNRLATLAAEGVTYSYTFNIGAYDGRGESIKDYVKKSYDHWKDDPAFEVNFRTLHYPNDDLSQEPRIFVSEVTGVINDGVVNEPVALKFPKGSAEQFETMTKADRPSAIEFAANPDADRFIYFNFQDIFTHSLREMGKNWYGRESKSFWETYKANKGITHITPGIYHLKTGIKILPIKNEDEVIFGDDHLMFVMANIKKTNKDEEDKYALPLVKNYQLTKLELCQLEYDGKYNSYFIDINMSDMPKRDMLFSIYDLSKESTDPELGVSIRIPKGTTYVKADLPDFLFKDGTNYKIFYHDALAQTYADFINIEETKLLLDLYQRAYYLNYCGNQDTIKHTMALLEDFESEKVNNLQERNIFIGENKTVRSFSQDGSAVIVGFGFGDITGKIEIQTFENGVSQPVWTATIGSWTDEEIRANIFPSGLTFDNWKKPMLIKVFKADGTLAEEFLYPFKDVEPGQWYAEAVLALWKQQIIHGVGNTDYFKPDDDVTRVAFIKMLTELLSKKESMPAGTVPGSIDPNIWYYPYLQKAYGYTNPNYNNEAIAFWGQSGPGGDNPWGQHVLRSEAAHMMMDAAKAEPPSWSLWDKISVRLFTDVPKDSADADWIYGCRKTRIVDGYPDNTFKPDKVLNRAEAAKVLFNAFLEHK